MNLAHIHLILNHVPVIGIPVALAFLLFGLFSRNRPTQYFALMILAALAAIALPVYFTGEPAEKAIGHLPGFAESFVEAHEDAALFSLIVTLAVGATAAGALWFQADEKKSRKLNFAVAAVACVAVLSLMYTANLGGLIRHTELRSDNAGQVKTENSKSEQE